MNGAEGHPLLGGTPRSYRGCYLPNLNPVTRPA